MSAVLAHEIRNPLGAIKGFAQLMKEENPSEVSIHEGCDVIIAESARLETLTQDLLIYARPGELALERFSIAELVDEVVRRFVADNPNLIINQLVELEQDIMYSDRHKIKQILINLAQNAIDASDKDQCVEIRATNQKNAICITVKDSGYGMDKATLEKAMTPFFTTKTKGTGLGLPIVQHLTQALNGTLAIESDNSKGTTVTATLPQLND
jgi:two-component system sensor histidine kinase HydH